jgi:hypothetical protein
MTNLKDNVLEKIHTGSVAMRPRWHFIVEACFFTVSVILTAIVAIYLLSLIFFILAKTGLWFAPGFGFAGLMFFVITSPWLIMLATGLFLALLAILVKHYAFSYRQPLIYSLIGVVAFVLIVSGLMHQMALHDRLRDMSERNNLPGLAPLYHGNTDARPKEITPGKIVGFTENGFTLTTPEGDSFTVVVSDQTRGYTVPLPIGSRVIVFGERSTSTIAAKGIRPLTRDIAPIRNLR